MADKIGRQMIVRFDRPWSVVRASRLVGIAVIAAIGMGCVEMALPGPPELSRNDHGPAQNKRMEIVEMIRSGQLDERDDFGDVLLPPDMADAAIHGRVQVRDQPFMVFFMTWTGLGPDPYCGYEYAPEADSLVTDPLGSGHGEAELIGDSWYWICAS